MIFLYLQALKELDREVKSTYQILVKATDDCWNRPDLVRFYDGEDTSILNVTVHVKDINDNPPKFTRNIFTGGITTDADFGSTIMFVTVSYQKWLLSSQI